mgnify:CR=1 FL=1
MISAIESIEPAKTGYLGGFNLPVIISWPIGGLLAALTAYLIGKIALGLRSDYLAIATLGISEIIIYVLKNVLSWLNPKGRLILHNLVNEYDIDVFIKYRTSKDSYVETDLEQGWNIISKKSHRYCRCKK